MDRTRAFVQRATEVLREERPIVGLGLLLRKFTFDSLNVYYFFEADLDQPLAPFGCPPGRDARLYQGSDSFETVSSLLQRTRLTPDDLRHRLQRGDLVSIALCEGQAVAYTWMNTSGTHCLTEVGLTVIFGPREAVQYDTFVLPRWRGQGFQFLVTSPVLSYAQQNGFKHALGYANLVNIRSLNNQRRQRKKHILTVWNLHVPRTRCFWNLRWGTPQNWVFTRIMPNHVSLASR
jgi:GNAT superfamily N-acetyltransferase